MQSGQLLLQLCTCLLCFCEPFSIPAQHPLQHGQKLCFRQSALPEGGKGFCLRILRGQLNPGGILADGALYAVTASLQLSGALPEPVLQTPVGLRPEQLPEDFLPFLRRGQQQPVKVSLRQHGNLGKLIPVNAQKLLHSLVDLLHPGQHRASRQNQLRLCLLQDGALSP